MLKNYVNLNTVCQNGGTERKNARDAYQHRKMAYRKCAIASIHLQHDRWIWLHFEMLASGWKSRAVNLSHANVRIDESLSDMTPNGFGAFAVCTPRCVEHYVPLAILFNVNKSIAQLQHPWTMHILRQLPKKNSCKSCKTNVLIELWKSIGQQNGNDNENGT